MKIWSLSQDATEKRDYQAVEKLFRHSRKSMACTSGTGMQGKRDERDELIWFIRSIWFNQINETNQRNQMNRVKLAVTTQKGLAILLGRLQALN